METGESGIVGRGEERAALGPFLGGLRDGPAALVLEGEPGIGKTTLLRAAAAGARATGCRVLAAYPAAAEVRLSFSGLTDLLEGVAHDVFVALPAPQREALEIVLVRADDNGRVPDQRTISVAVLSVFRRLAEAAPVLVVLDDLQWLDAPTRSIVAFALRRVGEARVSLLAAVRRASKQQDPFETARLLPGLTMRRLPVGPMAVDDLRRVVSDRLGATLPYRIAGKVHAVSGGNPFYAIEVVRAFGRDITDAPAGQPLLVPTELGVLVQARLAALPAPARRAVLVVAATAQSSTGLVSGVLGGAADDAIGAAVSAGVLSVDGDRVSASHPLLASVAYAEAGPEERRRLHAILAALIEDPEQHARHLALTMREPDAACAEVLDRGAVAAAARGAPQAAAELFEQAVSMTPPGFAHDWRGRVIAAAQHHAAAGDRSRAATLLEDLLPRVAAGPDRAEALLVLAEVRLQDDRFAEADQLLRQALDEVGDSPLRAQISLDMAFVVALQGNGPAAEPLAVAAVECAEGRAPPGLVAEALAVKAVVLHLLGRGGARPLLDRAIALEDRSRYSPLPVRPGFLDACVQMWSDELEGACAVFAVVHRAVVERGEEGALPLFGFQGGAVQAECWRGNVAVAAAYADAAGDAAERSGGAISLALARSAQSCVHAYRGDVPEARAEAREAIALFRKAGWMLGSLFPLGLLGFIELSCGDAKAALEGLGPLADPASSAGIVEPLATPFVPDAVEALIATGQPQRAADLLDGYQAASQALGRQSAIAAGLRCRALLAGAMGSLDEAEAITERALEAHLRGPRRPVELGRTLLVKGQLLRRQKAKRAAVAVLEDASQTFGSVDAAAWVLRAEAELARVGIRPSAPATLTAIEQQVAALAASGSTLKEIGAQLFLSPKTAEGILGRVYRKLGVGTRVALASALRASPISQASARNPVE